MPGDRTRHLRLASCARTRTSWSTWPRVGRRWSRRRCSSASGPRMRPTRPPTRCPGVAATGAGRAARRTSTRWSTAELLLAVRRRPRAAEEGRDQQASELLVLAPPTLEELRQQESVNNRATLRRAALIAVPLLLVGVGVGVYLGTTGGAEAGHGRRRARERRDLAGGEPGSRRRLVRRRAAPPRPHGAGRRGAPGHDQDRDGSRLRRRPGPRRLRGGRRQPGGARPQGLPRFRWRPPTRPAGPPGSRPAATRRSWWSKEASTGNDVASAVVDAGAQVVAVDGDSVYYVDVAGAHELHPGRRHRGPRSARATSSTSAPGSAPSSSTRTRSRSSSPSSASSSSPGAGRRSSLPDGNIVADPAGRHRPGRALRHPLRRGAP